MPLNESWTGEKLTMQIAAHNISHYAFSAGPASHQHLLQTIGYVPASYVSFGFTGQWI